MEENLIELLNSNLRVIIPDFGAFIIRQKQPRIVVFNEFLRYNDGLLIDYIARTEGIDREIAEQRVTDFAEENNKLLQGGKVVILGGLGKLSKDASGKIGFTEIPGIAENPEVKSEGPVIKKAGGETPKEVRKKRAVPAVKPKIKRSAQETAKTAPKAETRKKVPERAVEPPRKETAPEPPRVEKSPEPPVTLKAPEPSVVEETRATPPVIPGQLLPRVQNRIRSLLAGSTANQVMAWTGVFLLVNAAILAWFLIDNKVRDTRRNKAGRFVLSDSINERLADSVRASAMDTALVYRETVRDPEMTSSSANSSISRYYIVAGCFRDEINADALVTTLKGLGYKAEKFGKIGNLYAVCYASFDDKEEAIQELKRIRKRVPDTWMTRF